MAVQAPVPAALGGDPRTQVDLGVPQTSEELKHVKKLVRQKSVENVEKLFVLNALKRNKWNVTEAAKETGMQRSNLQALMKKYDIHVRDTNGEEKEGGPGEDPGAS